MKEIQIANIIVKRRREMGLTQDELAMNLGITKASVSKWETGLSYPDIVMLPRLASLFNISIDELLNYTPQLSQQKITGLYQKLAKDFAEKPFMEVHQECEALIKKYYSCFPFLRQMCILYLNHYPMAGNEEASIRILQQIVKLSEHIKSECNDASIIQEVMSIEAMTHLIMSQIYAPTNSELSKQELGTIFDLLGKDIKPPLGSNEVLINAYQLMGDIEKSKQLCQVQICSNLMSMLSSFPNLINLYADQPERMDEICHRLVQLLEIFDIQNLNPNMAAGCYYQVATIYMMQQKTEDALGMLKRYLTACINLFKNMTIHGDNFFDLLDNWLHNNNMQVQPPRSPQLVYDSVINSFGKGSLFEAFSQDKKIKSMLAQLRRNVKC